MGCREFDITDYFRLAPTTDALGKDQSLSTGTQKKSPRGFKPVVSVSISNYRYYSPELGRCLSRDPINEDGGYNLYAMVANDPINKWDLLGMSTQGLEMPLPKRNDPKSRFRRGEITFDEWRNEVIKQENKYLEDALNKSFCIIRKLLKLIPSIQKGNETSTIGKGYYDDFYNKQFPDFRHEWDNIVDPAAQYFLDNYTNPSSWHVDSSVLGAYATEGFNLNGWGWPVDPTISRDLLVNFDDDPIDALNIFLHEPQHNTDQRGYGHDGGWGDMLKRSLTRAKSLAFFTKASKEICCKKPNKENKINNKWDEIRCNCGVKY